MQYQKQTLYYRVATQQDHTATRKHRAVTRQDRAATQQHRTATAQDRTSTRQLHAAIETGGHHLIEARFIIKSTATGREMSQAPDWIHRLN